MKEDRLGYDVCSRSYEFAIVFIAGYGLCQRCVA
jgi:hypothetical protein